MLDAVSTPAPPSRPELLAPAGDWESLRAAAANGADAVYFGLPRFNARHRAENFGVDDLPRVVAWLHARNVRAYVAFNTLVFSDELEEAARLLAAVASAGADGVIVQDVGVARLLRALAPDLPVHGSTQMTLTEPRGIAFARRLGVKRVILARELSVDEVRRIAAETDVPLEVFVHGALCVAYSGQCLTSEALGGRSANRGQCAQACRLPYEMVVDGRPRDLGDKAYLLSPQDLAAHDLVGELVASGVRGLKIEGRLKGAHYVAVATRSYRGALDAALAGRPWALPAAERVDLMQSFSRGFSRGFLDGPDHQTLVQGRFPKSRGVPVGRVVDKTADGLIVQWNVLGPKSRVQGPTSDAAAAPRNTASRTVDGRLGTLDPGPFDIRLKPGDGVVIDEGHPDQDEQGGRVQAIAEIKNYKLKTGGGSREEAVEIRFAPGDINLPAVMIGSRIWRTDDPALRRRAEATWARDLPARRVPLAFRVSAAAGAPLRLCARDPDGREAEVAGGPPLAPATKHPASLALFREQLGRLGGTPFELGEVEAALFDAVLVPKSVLNDLRRRAVEALVRLREARPAPADPADTLAALRRDAARPVAPRPAAAAPALSVLVRSADQLDAVLAWTPPEGLPRPATAYCDFEDVRRYADAVARARAAGVPIGLATLRIVKPGEEGLLRRIAALAPEAVLLRNPAALDFFRENAPGIERIGDHTLNVANELAAALFAREGLARIVPSFDLAWRQLAALLRRSDPGLFEVVLHQHMPMFHMEHCVFAACLSDGKDWRDCGRPCDRHRVELKDRAGASHPVAADVGCRNTVFNAAAQSAAEYVPEMLAAGLRRFRIDLVRETAAETRDLLDAYARLIAGRDDGRAVWRRLRAVSQFGVTRGTIEDGYEV